MDEPPHFFALIAHEVALAARSAREAPVGAGEAAPRAGSRAPLQGLPDNVLRRLDFLLAHDGVLDRALEVLDAGGVTRVVGRPSGRFAWAVASTSLPPRPSAAELAAIDCAATGVSDVGTGTSCAYVVLLHGPGACTCVDFAARVLMGRGGDVAGGAPAGGMPAGGAPAGLAAVSTAMTLRQATAPAAPPHGASRRLCKHLLAAALAHALGPTRYRDADRSDEDLARMLYAAFGS